VDRLRLLGVFAHPDDEVFCAGGTLALYAERGVETMVVSATRGEAGQIRDADVATRSTLGTVREKELYGACAELGVGHVRLLGHRDGTLTEVPDELLEEEIKEVVDEFEPDAVITFGPDGMYGHPDHVRISEVASAVVLRRPVRLYHSHFARSRLLLVDRLSQWLTTLGARSAAPEDFARIFALFTLETTKLGYASDHVEIGWYPAGVYIVEEGEAADSLFLVLSGEVEVRRSGTGSIGRLGPGDFFGELGVARHASRSADVVAVDAVTCLVLARGEQPLSAPRGGGAAAAPAPPVDGAEDEPSGPTTVIDVRSVLDRKIRAIAAHRTQYPIDPAMFPDWMLAEMMGREYFIRVRPPACERDLFV